MRSSGDRKCLLERSLLLLLTRSTAGVTDADAAGEAACDERRCADDPLLCLHRLLTTPHMLCVYHRQTAGADAVSRNERRDQSKSCEEQQFIQSLPSSCLSVRKPVFSLTPRASLVHTHTHSFPAALDTIRVHSRYGSTEKREMQQSFYGLEKALLVV